MKDSAADLTGRSSNRSAAVATLFAATTGRGSEHNTDFAGRTLTTDVFKMRVRSTFCLARR
jgi:hypothetical protein